MSRADARTPAPVGQGGVVAERRYERSLIPVLVGHLRGSTTIEHVYESSRTRTAAYLPSRGRRRDHQILVDDAKTPGRTAEGLVTLLRPTASPPRQRVIGEAETRACYAPRAAAFLPVAAPRPPGAGADWGGNLRSRPTPRHHSTNDEDRWRT
jgi:hypothetical protein